MQTPIIIYNLLAIAALIFLMVCEAKMQRIFRWILIYAVEIAACIINGMLCQYFDSLPGGILGFAHFGEVVLCLIFAAVYGITLLITGAIHAFSYVHRLPSDAN